MTTLPDRASWQARGRVEAIYGHDVFTLDEGPRDAPVIVYLHGYPTSSHDLAPALPALTAGRRVIAHDHLGFGLSAKPADYSYSLLEQAEVALALWQRLGVTRAHLVAHDYGTSVATELLARRERGGIGVELTGVTLCNGSVHVELADLRLIQVLLRSRALGPLVARLVRRDAFAANMRRILARPEVLAEPDLDAMWALLDRQDGRARMPQITQYLVERRRFWHRWIGALTRLDLPCHVLWGTEDPVAVRAIAEAIAAETPGATLEWLDGLGHYPMLEDPARWSRALLAFIDR
ncbi:MAG: alpha/beta hydrolase [Myxococcales bacterium]|nr:alpha/beta hydrolase [Myxococcales bacterium]